MYLASYPSSQTHNWKANQADLNDSNSLTVTFIYSQQTSEYLIFQQSQIETSEI